MTGNCCALSLLHHTIRLVRKTRRSAPRALAAACLPLAAVLLALAAAGCSGEGGGMFENVTIDPARERVNALEEDTDAAERTVASYFAACDQEDGDRLAALFTQRAEVYLDGARVMPAADFVREQAAAWASQDTTVTEVNLRGVSLMRPYGWAKSLARVRAADGASRERSQAVTFGLERRGEIWMITHLHISSAGAPSQP